MIDVIMITKNAASHSPMFRNVLKILYHEVPVNRLIVVDAFSDDDTIKILREFPRVEIHQVAFNRAEARQYGIEQVETEWFMFLDDDVILGRDWFKIAQKYMEPGVGLIWGWDVIANPHSRNRMKVMYYLRRMSEYELMVRNFRHRGGTHDTLIRREAVEGIKIPNDLHFYEDWYIKKYVEDRGYEVITPRDLYCYHYLNPSLSLRSVSMMARLGVKYNIQPRSTVIRNFFLGILKSLAILTITLDFKASIDQLKYYTYSLIGVI